MNPETPAVAATPWRRRLMWALGLATGLLLSALAALAAAFAWYSTQLPPLDQVTDYQPRQPLQVFTRDGVEIALFGAERRYYVPIAEIPKTLQDAVLAVEDWRFRSHHGIDFIGVARALHALATGGMWQGASTITQQVARTFFLSSRLTPERKIKEALLALQIERRLTKDQILELYMNQIYLGQRAYGYAAAAEVYFGKTLGQLSIAESAMLAGLPQNPHYANPIRNAERARARQLIVLARMRDTGVIDEAQWAAARAEKLAIRSPRDGVLHAEHVAEIARRAVVAQFGPEVYAQGIKVTTSLVAAEQAAAHAALRRALIDLQRRQPYDGPEDHESLPPEGTPAAELERAAAQALKDHPDDEQLRVAIVLAAGPREVVAQLADGQSLRIGAAGLKWVQPALAPKAPKDLAIRRGSIIRVMKAEATPGAPDPGWSIVQWPEAEGALVALDPGSARVRAWVGGFDFRRGAFDHVSQAWRQPGSAFKPFLYSAALEHGVQPATLINDAPLTLPGAEGAPAWTPQNSDGQFDGALTLAQALARSKNLVSVRLLQQVGIAAARDWAQRFGFEPERLPDNLTLALGTGSTTPLQLAQAYALLANGGRRLAPVLIERITDAQGRVLFEAPPAPDPAADAAADAAGEEPALPARNLAVVQRLLNEVTRVGTAARAQQQLGRPDLYGKTGTTNDAVDAWFAGFQPQRVAVVWIGHDEPRSLGAREFGGGLALPVWIDYMRVALQGVPVAPPAAPPPGLVQVPPGSTAAEAWRYEEWAAGGFVERIGFDGAEALPAPAAGSSAPR